MSELLALGTSHKTAPLAVRERLALLEGQVEPFLHELVAHPAISEAVAVSTCNRTELYVVAGDAVEGESAVLALLARRAGTPPTALIDSIYADRNCDAARHLFRVVSGLESMIVGEAEIQGQVKRAYDRALAARTSGPLTNKLFRAALATGKRVRTETAISAGHASVATVAVDAARAVVGEPHHVVIVGAGDTSEQVARAFYRAGRVDDVRGQPPARPGDRAGRALRRRLRLVRRAARGAQRADVVVSSTASPHAIIGAEELAAVMARAGRPAAAAGRSRGAARHRPRVRRAGRRDAAGHGRAAGLGAAPPARAPG